MSSPSGPGQADRKYAEPLAQIARDPDAFAVFYREHVAAVTRFVARRVADPHIVADLTAEVFLAVIGSAGTYRPGRGTQVAWLYGIARNVIAGERRRAAVYHALAQVPGLTVVRKVTDIMGRAGVGIRSRPAPGLTWTAIFDPTTFKLLGRDIEPVGRGYDRTAMAVQATIVNKVGQRP